MPQPLDGQRVLITRAREQADALRGHLLALGATTLDVATIRLAPAGDLPALRRAAEDLHEVDWLVFTSPNGVTAFAAQAPPTSWPEALRVAAVGPRTAALLESLGRPADLLPASANGLAIAGALRGRGALSGQRLLLPRGNLAAGDLPAALREAGADVREVEAYRVEAAAPDPALTRALAAGEIQWVTILSGSAMKNLLAMLPAPAPLRGVRFASIGPKTSAIIRALGYAVSVEAEAPTPEALARAMGARA